MSLTEEHPTVRAVHARPSPPPPTTITAERLQRICRDAGADDVGFVSIDREEIASERPHALAALAGTRTFVAIVTRLQREDVRTPMRSVGNPRVPSQLPPHQRCRAHDRRRARARAGIRALNPSAGFPMEMDRYPGRIWVVAHKPIAVAAGLGQIGIHRNVIHPVFGSFVNLATILVAADIDEETRPVAFNPCLECKLCVAACPVGAIEPDGYFNFSACVTHNYREFMGGFTDWTETIADAKDGLALQKSLKPSEQASMWQSLSFGANYKAAYCVAVCPAGEDVIGPYLADKGDFKRDVLKPLTEKREPIYVVAGTDAEAHVTKRFPHKTARRVRATLRPQHIPGFLMGIKLTFQRAQVGRALGDLPFRLHRQGAAGGDGAYPRARAHRDARARRHAGPRGAHRQYRVAAVRAQGAQHRRPARDAQAAAQGVAEAAAGLRPLLPVSERMPARSHRAPETGELEIGGLDIREVGGLQLPAPAQSGASRGRSSTRRASSRPL